MSDEDQAAGEQLPALGDLVEMEPGADDDQHWVVLFDEDYEDIIIDGDDSVALLVDHNQAVELLRLASKVVGRSAPDHAPDKEPVEAMIEALQEERDPDD